MRGLRSSEAWTGRVEKTPKVRLSFLTSFVYIEEVENEAKRQGKL